MHPLLGVRKRDYTTTDDVRPSNERMMSATHSELASRSVEAPKRGRYHELDFLRGWMMMLGLVLHSAIAYMQTPMGELWGYKDSQSHFGFDLVVAFLHTFRMPVFFMLSGFFACMLYEDRGVSEMVRNRRRRVLYPLVVGWLFLFPLTVAGFGFGQLGGTREGAKEAIEYVVTGKAVEHLQLLHLWFLFDLLIYYASALLISRLVPLVDEEKRTRFLDRFAKILGHWWAPLPFALITAFTLLPMPSGTLETPGTFFRPLSTLVANGVFFVFGWLLYHRRSLLSGMVSYAWRWTLFGVLMFAVHGLALMRFSATLGIVPHTVTVISLAVVIWLFVFGLTGLFVRYLAHPSPLGRYIADASYWFYLVHLPLVAWGSGLLAGRDWPAGVKYVVLLASVIGICWVTYDLFVRPTVIGLFLNGRRYPRGLPSEPV